MADKQIIIIEGCDLSEWTDEEIRYKFKNRSPKAIRQIAFDLYKQLQAKEQECEELKEDRERWKSNFNGKVSAIEELLKQLDQLKVEFDKKELIFAGIETSNKLLIEKNNKLKQTLIEIKEIAENREIFCENCDSGVESFTCEDCGYVKILQKISEGEVKDE